MSEFNINIESGKSVRLLTAGKYCDRDIVVTAEGGTPTPTQEKTVEITANGTVSVAPDEGYALSKVTANVNVPIPEGYIKPNGELEVTENGIFDVTDKASVNVNVPTGGGGTGDGDDNTLNAVLDGSKLELSSNVTILRKYAFFYHPGISKVSLPNATTIGIGSFNSCTDLKVAVLDRATDIRTDAFKGSFNLEEVVAPNLVSVSQSAFEGTNLKSVDFPLLTIIGPSAFHDTIIKNVKFTKVQTIGSSAFQACVELEKVDLTNCGEIGALAFNFCNALTTIILRGDIVCNLLNVSAFINSAVKNKTGYIYVPKALIDAYKSATNWSNYASQIRAIEDYPDICGD